MAGKISLPHHSVVAHWNEDKVIRWLKKVHLDDCIPAFEMRHIDGSKLLELSEQKLFTYQDLKIKHRKQIAKCVQECKSQATNAKRIARSIKKSHSSHSHESVDFNGEYESGDDSDDWGSDFDSDSEEERKSDQLSFELNNNTIIDTVSGALERSSLSNAVEEDSLSHTKSIPKPPDVPVISKIVNNSNTNMKSSNHINIPRQPLKRPPSQPPPPPVSQASSHEEQQEDYEIPIVNAAVKEKSCDQSLLNIPFEETSSIETYELIEPPEEEYEVVDAPPPQTILEKPVLPPRHPTSSLNISPPPLPQKPKKLKESLSVQERTDGIRMFSRSKIPGKAEEDSQDSQTDIFQSSPTSGFISSLMGRRSSTPTSSPKSLHKSKDYNDTNSSSTASSSFSNENLSSHSLFLNKDGSGSVSDLKKVSPLPPLPPRSVVSALEEGFSTTTAKVPLPPRTALNVTEETVQNMATRPLPPVPVPKEENKSASSLKEDNLSSNKQLDIQTYPWFHEIEREDAEEIVKGLKDSGSFVVRPSKRAGKENPYSLTILHEGKLFHLNIRLRSDNLFALGKEKKKEKTFFTVSDLIAYHQLEPILLTSRGEPAGKTVLVKYPEKT